MAWIRPSFMDNMSWEMAEVYGAITDQILINLAKYFPFWKSGESVPRSAFEYQANMLAQMGQVNRDTIRIIANGLGGANKALTHILEQAIMESVKKSQPDLLKGVREGLLHPAGIPIVDPQQTRAFRLYYQQAAQKLNLVNTVMLESTGQAYQATVADIAARVRATQTALDIGAGETVTGVSSWNQALRHSIQRMKDNGITGFIDHANHHWSAEAYAAMDIRTTVANTARAAVWETNQDFGNDLYIVSYHDGARPLCYPWQNKVISANNREGTTTDLDGNEIEIIPQNRTSYGEPAGLFGINCKHYPSPFIPGVSVLYDKDNIMSEKENAKVYKQTQQQRALERQIREQKRDLLMAKNMGASKDELNALRAKIRETDDEIDAFCADTGLPRRQSREGVFTTRSFPDKDTYDVTTFERQQKEAIDQYFSNNGAQQNYTFGQMEGQEAKEAQRKFETAEDFDREIERLRQKRHDLFQQDTYDKSETDRLINEIFALEDRKKEFITKQFNDALDASATTTRPANEPDNLKQFKRFDVSKRTDAQMLAQVNPNYTKYDREWTYNCQRAVAAQEAVYRGYDVTAMGYHAKDAIGDKITKVFETTNELYKDPGLVMLGNGSTMEAKLQEAFAGWGDGSRGVVRLYWNTEYGSHGHFIYARNVGGQIILSDPQDGQFINGGLSFYKDRVTSGKQQMWVMRVDNRPFTNNISLAMKNRGD